MAREKSFLPPEEMKLEQRYVFEEELVQESEVDQPAIEELVAQISPDSQRPSEQGTLGQPGISPTQELPRVTEGGLTIESQPSQQQDSGTVVSQPVTESTGQVQTRDEVRESIVSGPAYTVQVGYFSVESNARGLAREIEGHGFQTYVLKHNDAYKVQAGAYQTRQQAEAASLRLKDLGYEIWVTQR